MGEFTIPAIHSIFFCQHGSFSLSVFLESPDPSNCWGMNCLQIILWVRAGVMNTIYVLWTQESQAMTLYNPPHHLSSQSVQWHPQAWIKERQDRKPIELFCEHEPFCLFFSNPLLFFFYSTLCLPAQAYKLYQQIQLSNTRPRSIRPETNFGRQQWKKKMRPVL